MIIYNSSFGFVLSFFFPFSLFFPFSSFLLFCFCCFFFLFFALWSTSCSVLVGRIWCRNFKKNTKSASSCGLGETCIYTTIDEIATRLHRAKVFTVLDVRQGFWHVPLDEKSSLLTTFNTPFGRYRWK